jgi:hypothetical protein
MLREVELDFAGRYMGERGAPKSSTVCERISTHRSRCERDVDARVEFDGIFCPVSVGFGHRFQRVRDGFDDQVVDRHLCAFAFVRNTCAASNRASMNAAKTMMVQDHG